MKPLIIASTFGIAIACLPAASMAACAAPAATRVGAAANLTALLSGMTVCVASTKPGWTWEWQEQHQAPNILVDYKKGLGDPIDPSKPVGTWSITGTAGRSLVTHDYGGGQIFSYTVWNNGNGTHSFCSANPEIIATIKAGPC